MLIAASSTWILARSRLTAFKVVKIRASRSIAYPRSEEDGFRDLRGRRSLLLYMNFVSNASIFRLKDWVRSVDITDLIYQRFTFEDLIFFTRTSLILSEMYLYIWNLRMQSRDAFVSWDYWFMNYVGFKRRSQARIIPTDPSVSEGIEVQRALTFSVWSIRAIRLHRCRSLNKRLSIRDVCNSTRVFFFFATPSRLATGDFCRITRNSCGDSADSCSFCEGSSLIFSYESAYARERLSFTKKSNGSISTKWYVLPVAQCIPLIAYCFWGERCIIFLVIPHLNTHFYLFARARVYIIFK